ncbi:MAG TPA: ribosome rescue GTPase HflX [Steroidobacteraceae bacterium]|nr:ribosome rescue GTPase HflX [Steroidobacteraceae bacterium]
MFERPERGERAVLVRIGLGHPPDAEELGEFDALARSAGAIPVATIVGSRRSPEPRYFVGSGKADEIRDRVAAEDADLVLVDHELSPSQERNLEKHVGRRVLDRAGLILDIFASRARSAEGKLEVELAQLRHLSTRLVRGWTHLERQKGGIGLRGPGETQLETDRRLIGKRIRTLTAKLEKLAQRRDTGRQVRKRVPVPGLALIGYTNAGKSTLFRALTGADAYVADQLFATLDPTVRRLKLPHTPDLVVADTVGFVRDLPHELVAAFRSTLMEAREADLLLHVVDAADPEREQRIAQVDELIAGIGAGEIPQLRVYNKVDRLGRRPELVRDAAGRPSAVWLSAATGAGLALLREALQEIFGQAAMRYVVTLPPEHGRLRAKLYATEIVRAEETLPDGGARLAVETSHRQLENLCREAGIDFAQAVSPCLPAAGFVEFPRDTASSAA